MEDAVKYVILTVFIMILFVIMSIYMYHAIGQEHRSLSYSSHQIKATMSTVSTTLQKMQLLKISISGNFTDGQDLEINLAKLVKIMNGRTVAEIVKTYGFPNVIIHAVYDGTKPVFYAVVYNGSTEVYNTLGNEYIYRSGPYYIEYIDFTGLNTDGKEIGLTLYSGTVCGTPVNSSTLTCYFRMAILIHSPNTKLPMNNTEITPPKPPHGFIIR